MARASVVVAPAKRRGDDGEPETVGGHLKRTQTRGGSVPLALTINLVTVLIVLAIIALVLFILGRR